MRLRGVARPRTAWESVVCTGLAFREVDGGGTGGPNQIGRENGRRRIIVCTNADGGDVGSVIKDVESGPAATPVPVHHTAAGDRSDDE